jgi:NAD+ kinase
MLTTKDIKNIKDIKNVHYEYNPIEHNDRVKECNKTFSYLTKSVLEDCDFILCAGGDGTLLKTINKYSCTNATIIGINAGTVGFLMNDLEDVIEWLNNPEHLHLHTQKFKTIDVEVVNNKRTYMCQAFNDVMIGGDMNSWIEFDINEKSDIFGKFQAGGMIISTAQGSTGINKNNHGSILPIDSKLWSITGDKSNRKIDYVIKPRKTKISVTSRQPVSVWVDGSNTIIKNVNSVTIKKGIDVSVGFLNIKDFIKKRRL